MINKNLNFLRRHPTLIHDICAPAQRREGGEGSGGSERNRRENEYSENSWIFQDDENLLTLTRNPNSIHELWDEDEFGIGDRKVVKSFTSKERGGCKYTYHQRKVVWENVEKMARSGWNAAASCNLIYIVYGQQSSVIMIVNRMIKDRRSGGNTDLQRLNVNNI